MAKTIWKLTLNEALARVEVPKGTEFLTAREQNDQICVWFLCDPDAPKEARTLEICGTGSAGSDGRYLGSCHLRGGAFIFHVFEITGP